MENIKTNSTHSESKKLDNQVKEYKKPRLTSYGGISELVLANGGAGTDGGPLPPFTLT